MLGAIADDFTGATDVAIAFNNEGLRTTLHFGAPLPDAPPAPQSDAVVIALRTRTLPFAEAAAQSANSLKWLRDQGADQIYFKYCSTFDSTPQGNIGPVLDALSDALGVTCVITTPSSPVHRRTQYQGYLFVDDILLAESHMAHHPINPMTESSLLKLLGAQTSRSVGLIPWETVRRGQAAIRAHVAKEAARGTSYLFADAVSETDLNHIAEAVRGELLVAGAAGLAGAIAHTTLRSGAIQLVNGSSKLQQLPNHIRSGPIAFLSGSCSVRTLQQVQELRDRGHPVFEMNPLVDDDSEAMVWSALQWYETVQASNPLAPVFCSSTDTAELAKVHARLGPARASAVLESASGQIAAWLSKRGFTRIVTAGGETAGAVVTALGVAAGRLGPEAAAGVPWIVDEGQDMALLLKSGNFGPRELLVDLAKGNGTG